ncbi:MAG: helix-turn-helix domain-containing protein [Candidatus Nanoarchaeia archaeon]|nr:helix-turn-helix domain-containing protein [Candidatus Nanoarchaeia archaeon]
MNTEIFEELGLTRTEIKIYLTLLEIGSSTAGTILEKSKLPNSTVHRDLNTLIEKGLINFILEGKRKVYQATNPEYFFNFIEEKKRKFEEILPELKEKQKKIIKEEFASVYKGVRGIKEVYNIMINTKGKEYNTFGGGPITSKIMGFTWWLSLHKKRVANNLPSRQVFDESVREGGKDIAKNPLTKIKYVDKEFAQFQETVIVGDLVAIAVFSENPYAFLIKDKNVAESYRKYFELLWKMAKN